MFEYSGIIRFDNKVVRTQSEGLDFGVLLCVSGRNDDGNMGERFRLTHLFQHFIPIHNRHGNIQKYSRDGFMRFPKYLERIFTITGLCNLVILSEYIMQYFPIYLVIVNDKDVFQHGGDHSFLAETVAQGTKSKVENLFSTFGTFRRTHRY